MLEAFSSAGFRSKNQDGPWYYVATADRFRDDAENPRKFCHTLADAHRKRWGENPTGGEVFSWERSSQVLSTLLEDADCTKDQMVVFEYCFRNAGRIDVLLCGMDRRERLNAILLELKRWQRCTIEESSQRHSVRVDCGNGFEDRLHPSVQVLRYRDRLRKLLASRERKGVDHVRLSAYAYLHNCSPASENIANMRRFLYHRKFQPYLYPAPLFMEENAETLQRKIRRRVERGRGEEVLQRLVW